LFNIPIEFPLFPVPLYTGGRGFPSRLSADFVDYADSKEILNETNQNLFTDLNAEINFPGGSYLPFTPQLS
jgi:hypothetical protein